MAVELPFEASLHFSPADDLVHAPGAQWDWTETAWFAFHVPDRALMGWLYVQMRPNQGTVAGGAFVYGPPSAQPWEVPYFAYQHHQPLPDPLDLRDVTFRTGVSITMVEPGMVYDLGYRFRDHDDLVADLRFEGITPPIPHVQGAPPFSGSSHYDQPGRVTGTLDLRGDRIEVDCVSIRDRSWGRRPELLGRGGRLSYVYGAASTEDAFLAFCVPSPDDAEIEHLSSGYLLRDGRLCRLAEATRRVVRRTDGMVERIDLDAVDTDGRRLVGRAQNRSGMFLPTSGMCINSYLRWEYGSSESDLVEGWGEDQDVWSFAALADRVHGQPTRRGSP